MLFGVSVQLSGTSIVQPVADLSKAGSVQAVPVHLKGTGIILWHISRRMKRVHPTLLPQTSNHNLSIRNLDLDPRSLV